MPIKYTIAELKRKHAKIKEHPDLTETAMELQKEIDSIKYELKL